MRHSPLTPRQLFWTAFLMIFPTIVLLLPGDLLRLAGRYAWWTPLAAGLPAAAFVWGAGRLAGRHGGLGDVLLRLLGPVAGRVLLGALCAALAVYAVIITREYAQVAAVTYVFEDVPVAFLTTLGLTLAGLAAWLGLAVIARSAEAIAPLLIVVLAGIVAMALPFAHALWALPLLPRNIRFASLPALGRAWAYLAEPAALTLALHRADAATRASAGRILAGAVASASVLSAGVIWAIVACFGPPRAAELILPFFNVSKQISFGLVIEHVEILLVPIILMGGAGKMAVFYWLWANAAARLTRGGERAWLVAGLVGLGTASVRAFSSAVALDRALYTWGTLRALPVLAGVVGLAYGGAEAVRRVVRRT